MAVKDENIYHPTNFLILARPRNHYRVHVVPIHWQLRSIITSGKGRFVYFPGGNSKRKIIKLDTKTREYETLRVLQFSPRCLVSKNGWLCCGGETGEFVAIRLDSTPDNNQNPASSSPSSASSPTLFGLDSRSPLSEPLSPTQSTEDALRSIMRTIYAPSQSCGKDRVNCITMWFPDGESTKDCAYQEPVAVLSNNDKNVTFATLNEGESTTLDTVIYPDCVNRAVISPDGSLCAVICDDPFLYIHERTKKQGRDGGYEWVQRTKVHLKSQRLEDKSDNRGSFAVCFSNTGRYLAVGTQYGIISIFDTAALLEPDADPLLTDFGSSRPNSDAGAVREMAFCPGPFDLLAWTEDRGHVGIADIRRNYVSRQILHLDKKDDFDHFDITDKQQLTDSHVGSRPADLLAAAEGADSHFLRAVGERQSSSNTSTSASTSNSQTHTSSVPPDGPVDTPRTSVSRDMESEIRRYNAPLSREETMVLDAMREINRRRREADTADRSTAQASSSTSTSNTRPPRERSASVTRNNAAPESRLVRDILAEATNTWRDFVPSAGPHRLRERYLADTLRRGVLPPRRTVRLGETSNGSGAGGPSRTTGAPPPRLGQRSAWADLEALYNLGAEREETESRRDRDLLLRPGMSPYSSIMRDYDGGRATHARSTHSTDDETAGMSWSEDGRVLFVGTEDGIYEFHVNVAGRKLFPSITMR
ncbi:uncharacterized protein MKZ38_009877 [Zalerion maritima]|uniref:DUF2415 domain-containing protein n=1 Tax=Zalerion maritima TaxID=339359 RepID=A0AAD5RSX4_9PEZI|nr:uncharacterized protein MKZ38_009877 [Zalerion maritima]